MLLEGWIAHASNKTILWRDGGLEDFHVGIVTFLLSPSHLPSWHLHIYDTHAGPKVMFMDLLCKYACKLDWCLWYGVCITCHVHSLVSCAKFTCAHGQINIWYMFVSTALIWQVIASICMNLLKWHMPRANKQISSQTYDLFMSNENIWYVHQFVSTWGHPFAWSQQSSIACSKTLMLIAWH